MTDLWLACCVIKMQENSLSGSVNLFKGVNVIDIRSKWFGNFSQVRVIEGQFVPREPKLVRVIGSFEKSRAREIGNEIVELE